jgi:hypothetical protein
LDLDAAIVVPDSDATDASKEAGAAACESPNECEPAFCTDGVCCVSGCDGGCQHCGEEGESPCDAEVECLADAGAFPLEPTQGCPLPGSALPEARAYLDGPTEDCWVGDSWETATANYGRGQLQTGPEGGDSRIVSAYAFSNEWSLKTQAYDDAGVLLRGCVAVDNQADQAWVRMTFNHGTCKGAVFVRVTAHASSNGDL